MTTIIAACDLGGGIGYKNTLPWGHIPEDMRHFQHITNNKTVVVGRKTFESLPKPELPGRKILVLTRQEHFGRDVETGTFESVIKRDDFHELIFAGGSEIYKQVLSTQLVRTAWITHIHDSYRSDKQFPHLSEVTMWNVAYEQTIFVSSDASITIRKYENPAF